MSDEINDGGPAFPAMTPGGYCTPGMTLRDYLASQEQLNDYDTAVISTRWLEAVVGRAKPEDHNTAEGVMELMRFENEFRARLKYLRADAMLKARDQQPDTTTAQQIALGLGGGK